MATVTSTIYIYICAMSCARTYQLIFCSHQVSCQQCAHNPMTTMASYEPHSSVMSALSTIAGSDYNSISNLRLEFGPTRYLNLVRVPILNDDIHETLQESFSAILILDSPSLPRINIFPSQAKITIEDGNAVYMFICLPDDSVVLHVC